MEWHHERATVIPAEHVPTEHVPADHANRDLSQIGVVVYADSLFADALIGQCAADLAGLGFRLGGIVQSDAHPPEQRRFDIYVHDRLGGNQIKILLDRGNEARGRRLDSHGGGLRSVITDTVIAEVPLLNDVSKRNLCDFLTFIGDSASHLRLDLETITAWCRNAIQRGSHGSFQPRLSAVQP